MNPRLLVRRVDLVPAVAWAALGLLVVALLTVTGLGARGEADPVAVDATGVVDRHAPARLPALRAPLREPALLVVADARARPGLARRVSGSAGVATVERVGIASLQLMGRTVTAAAVAPGTYRRMAPAQTARTQAVWDAVARGDAAVAHGIAEGLRLGLGGTVSTGAAGEPLRLGAIAATVDGIDLVVSRRRGAQLGLPPANGVVVALRPGTAAADVRRTLRRQLERGVTITDLTDRGGVLAAGLVGGDVAQAVGSFSYRWFADGTVAPDPQWVAASLVTGEVPILGSVTCHRVMLPQLRAALQEVMDLGLAGAIDPADFGGCYSPRFIERDPTRGLSLHTWGIAVDLNVSGNQVGTVGSLDRRVVDVFERWGFAWGGRWRVPDPMHFELADLRG